MKAVIFLPAYNEATVIGDVLAGLPKSLQGIDTISVVVVDDGSSDATSEIAKKHGAIVARHRLNRGVGLAKVTGIATTLRLNADCMVTLDSDGQHDPDEIPRVLAPILSGEADVVVGTRLLNPKGMPWIRRFGNQTMNTILRFFTGVKTTDSQSGFRAYSRRALEAFHLTTSGYEVDTEILLAAGRAHLRITEVPIKVIYTEYSKKKGQTITNSLNVVLRLIAKTIIG